MSDPSVLDCLRTGEPGDKEVTLRLTVRELVAVEFLLVRACRVNGLVVATYRDAEREGLGNAWNVALRSAQMRIGLAFARLLGSRDHALDFAAMLAALDQERRENEKDD